MLNQRKCPCCVGNQEPAYRQNIPQTAQKSRKVQRLKQQQLVQEDLSEVSDGKPYAYLGEGEIWANGAFMNILQKKYGPGGVHHRCPHSPCPSSTRGFKMPASSCCKPTVVVRGSISPHCCSPTIKVKVSPARSSSPTRRRTSSPRRGTTGSSAKISCTYRVCPIKSRSEIRDGDLIIETSSHKFLKVLGVDELSNGDDFFVMIDMGKKSRGRSNSPISSSSPSGSDEEIYTSKGFVAPTARPVPRCRFRRLAGPCVCMCCNPRGSNPPVRFFLRARSLVSIFHRRKLLFRLADDDQMKSASKAMHLVDTELAYSTLR